MKDKNKEVKTAQVEKDAKPQKAKRFAKGSKEVEHDLFKLLPATMKRNISWKWKRPNVVQLEHCHIFHSVDSDTLKANKYSTSVGGHFHEINVDWEHADADGQPRIVCGPPLEMIKTQIDDEVIREIVPVVFEVHDKLKRKGAKDIVDDHTHELEYLGSETLTQNGTQELRASQKKVIAATQDGTVSKQFVKGEAMKSNAEKVQNVVKETAPAPRD